LLIDGEGTADAEGRRMTIACATHFSDSSNDAVHVAALLARRTNQRLVIATVLPAIQLSAPDGKAESDATERLDALAKPLLEAGVRVDTLVLHGALDTAISSLCQVTGAQLLLVGDSSRPFSTFFGTPADRLAYEITVPMIMIRSARPFHAWAMGEGPLRVMLAIDHSWSSALARDWITKLAEYGRLDLVATHLWSPEEQYRRRGLAMSTNEKSQQELAARLLQETEHALGRLPLNVTHRVHLEIAHGHIASLLNEIAAREHVDLVVLGTHVKTGLTGLLSSVSHEVLTSALMSVAFIPEKTTTDTTQGGHRQAVHMEPSHA
jgi:nucleotide-binding universal stress UspA family protein